MSRARGSAPIPTRVVAQKLPEARARGVARVARVLVSIWIRPRFQFVTRIARGEDSPRPRSRRATLGSGRVRRRHTRAFAAALVASLVAPAALATPPQPPPRRLDEPGRSAMPANQYGPRIAVAERGPVVVFRDDRDGEFTTRASHRGNEGWASNPSPDAHIASDGDGRAWMAWVEEATLRTLSTSGDGEWTEGPHVSDRKSVV